MCHHMALITWKRMRSLLNAPCFFHMEFWVAKLSTRDPSLLTTLASFNSIPTRSRCSVNISWTESTISLLFLGLTYLWKHKQLKKQYEWSIFPLEKRIHVLICMKIYLFISLITTFKENPTVKNCPFTDNFSVNRFLLIQDKETMT